MEDPLGAVALLKQLKPETDLEIENPGVKLLAPLWSTQNGVFGWQDQSKWEEFTMWMVNSGRLDCDSVATCNVSGAYDNHFVEKAN